MADIKVISETIQEFRGERFYLCGFYYQHKGKRLHRFVWESYNGPIPEGYHVHHIDEDRANNEIENLSLMPGIEHCSMHMKEAGRIECSRKNIEKARSAAAEWHGSEAGYEMHSRIAKKYWDSVRPFDYTCTWCGKHYQSKQAPHKGNHFCGNNCRAAYGRAHRKGKV